MLLYEKLSEEIKQARLGKDTPKLTFLGVLKGEIQNESSRAQVNIDNGLINIVAGRMQKSLAQVNSDEAKQELEYLKDYLPQLLSAEEIYNLARKYEAEGAKELKDFMQLFNRDYKGKVDNSIVKDTVTALLSM